MSGTRKRRGTTLVELSLVIAILAMIALPFATFVSQNLKNTMLSSTQLKEQMVLEQVMQDMEKHLRSAISTPDLLTPNTIVFTSRDPHLDIATPPVVSTYIYELVDGLFYKNDVVFPDGLEVGLITSLTFPAGVVEQNPDTAQWYITVRLEARRTELDPDNKPPPYLQKTIYLRNYTSITQLTITDPTLTLSKPYDGNTTAAVIAGALSGVVSPDDVTVTAVATYNSAAVGVGKTITVVYTLAGGQAGNYAEPVNDTVATGEITTKQLTITAPALTLSKPYDGNATATVTAVGTLSGVVSGDAVTVTAVATYNSAAVGVGKTITVVYTLAGGQAGNYAEPVNDTVATGAITTKQLTITAPALTLSKPYDGNTTATVTAVGTLSGVVSGDAVTVTAVATYNSAAVGAGKTITVVYTLAGGQAGNYAEPVNDTVATGAITTKQLMITAPALTLSKPYDGNTTAAVTAGALVGKVGSEDVTVTAVATYDTAAVGVGKTITVVYILGGADAAKYIKPVDYTVTTGVITPVPITAIGAITDGTFKIGSVLTAGALTPSDATVTYQWQRADSARGPYTNISGATSSTYTPVTPADKNMFIRVVATGTGNYSGTVTSAATEKINP